MKYLSYEIRSCLILGHAYNIAYCILVFELFLRVFFFNGMVYSTYCTVCCMQMLVFHSKSNI